MPDWVLWLIGAVVLAVGEVFTLGFFLGPIALAAALAAVVAAVGLGAETQLATFVVASVALLLIMRPGRETPHAHPRRGCAPGPRLSSERAPPSSIASTRRADGSACAARSGRRARSTATA